MPSPACRTACGGDDCDDEDDARSPGNAEICDRDDVDENCDLTTFGHRDADGDGWPDARCCNRGDRRDQCGNDCDDELAGMHPTAVEACDSVDNDCDGAADDGEDAVSAAAGLVWTWSAGRVGSELRGPALDRTRASRAGTRDAQRAHPSASGSGRLG